VVTALFKGEGFKEGMARQPAFRQASEAGEKAGGEAVPGEGEGRAAEFSIGGGIQGGGVHASDAAQESAVECFGSSGGFGSAWGKGPDLTGIGEDRGDEGVKETAKSGRGGDVELGAAPVQGMQGALASRVEVGGGGGDALFGVEGNAQVTIGVGGGDRGGAKVPSGGGGAGWAGWVEHHNLSLGQVDVELGGDAEGVQGVQLVLQASGGGAQQGEVVGVKEQGDREAGQGRGGGVGSSDEGGHAVDVEAKEQGAEGAALLDAQVTGEGICEARGGGGAGCDAGIQGLEG
jgi:hypothetical protein